MGLRVDGYATVWDKPQKRTDSMVSMRATTSYKNRDTEEYVQDFCGYLTFIGKNAAPDAMHLSHGDRIKIKSFEVTSRYDKDAQKEYINYKVYDFEVYDPASSRKKKVSKSSPSSSSSGYRKKKTRVVDELDAGFEEEIDLTNEELPF